MEIQECLGAENQLGIDIWKHKYRYQDETLEQWLGRVNGGSAIAELIREKKVLEGGRNLYKSCGRSKCQNRHINGGGGI